MKFSFFFIAEYANVVTVCAMITTLFFGGWDIPFTNWDRSGGLLPTLVTWLVFFLKVLFWVFVVMWIRWTLPRFRYDQLMALGWKVLMPIALAYIMVMCVAIYVVERVFGLTGPVPASLALFGLNVGLGILVFGLLDSGVFIRGSGYRQQEKLKERGAREARAAVAG
jgi:NADH-quinone oxidoreductase subunit H